MGGSLVVAGVLIAVAVVIYSAFARDLARARARVTGCSATTNLSNGPIEYSIVGSGEPTLVIHGAGGGFDQALDVAGPLAQRGYELIAPSRFGYLSFRASCAPCSPPTRRSCGRLSRASALVYRMCWNTCCQ